MLAAIGVLVSLAHAYEPARFPDAMRDRYSPLKLLANYAPYNPRSGVGISTDVPEGCSVDQVVLLGRHAERYPDPENVADQLAALQKLQNATLVGDLAFLNDWTYFLEGHMGDAALLTRSGVYAGTADAYAYGALARGTYGDLWDSTQIVPIFSANNERVLNTARAFGQGFFGYNYSTGAAVNLLQDSGDVGGNSLGTSFCNSSSATWSPEINNSDFDQLNNAAARINNLYKTDLNATDVFNLIDLTAHDVILKGTASPWLDVFTAEEFLTYSYIRSLILYTQHGPGSPFARAVGANFMNATSTLFNAGPPRGLALSLNFAYDTTVTSVLAGAGLVVPTKNLSLNSVTFDTGYDASDIAPMGARLVFERLNCSEGLFVRAILNDAVTPFPYDHTGPGFSTPLDAFTEFNARFQQENNYTEICRPIELDVPTSPTFWWSYNTTDYWNYPVRPIIWHGDYDT